MKLVTAVAGIIALLLAISSPTTAQPYMGTQLCQGCHSNASIGGIQYTQWTQTLHSKIHLLPDTVSIRPVASFTNGDSISMGASYGNAKVYLSRSGSDFYAKVAATGNTYTIAWTYGWGFKQRYLVKIDTGNYMLPIQYNLNKYLDNSSGTWASYNPGNWFNSDGTVKPIDNAFRTKSWDKNCMGCHVTAGKVEMVVAGADTSWHATWANNNSKENIVVGCEACHGPYAGGGGPGHQMNPSKLNTKDQKLQVCGQCHNRASSNNGFGTAGTHEFNKNEFQNTYFNPADTAHPLAEFMNFSTPPNQKGGPGTWPDLITARQHHQQYQEFLGSTHYDNPFEEITCFTCHTAHSNSTRAHDLRDSLVVGSDRFLVDNDNNTLCLSCHATHGPFAAIPKTWVGDPVTYKDSIGAVANQHSKHNLYDPENQLTTGGIGRCTKCHMTKTAITAKAYDIHSHLFKTVSPSKTLQYQAQGGMPNTCAASCHRNGAGRIPNFGITDASLSTWNEATDESLATELRFWDENMFYKERGGKGADISGLPTATAPVIDADTSDWSDATWADVALANGKLASVKSKTSGGNFYMFFRWADPTFSMVRGESWVRTGTTWTKNPGQSEDRIALMWNIDIPQSKWEQNGCMTKCHFDVNNPVSPDGDPEDDSYLMQGEHGDLWHMKPARGLGVTTVQQSGTVIIDSTTHQATSGVFKLVGYIDDQNMKEYVGKPDGGRVGDAGSGLDTRNRNAAQTGPLYIEKNPTDYIDAMVLTKAEIDSGEAVYADSVSSSELDTYWGNYQALGAVVPERYVKPPAGSRGDVEAAGLWDNGVWYLEVRRVLNTGNTDDAQLTLGQIVYFGMALMDNGGGEAHWTLGTALNKFGVGIAVGVEQGTQLVPEQFVLNQNYPNPFNPTTIIRFTLPKDERVRLAIYDILGREVATLVSQKMIAGNYSVVWDGKNKNGAAVSSGIYLYRIEAGPFVKTHKMLLIR